MINYSDKHRILWATPERTATRSCIEIQKYFGFDVFGQHDLEIPKNKKDYFFIFNTRNPYIRMISLYHLFCVNNNFIPNNFNNWIREKLYEQRKYPNHPFNYQIFLKEQILKTPDLVIRVESLYSDILKIPIFTDNSDELFDVVNHNILRNAYSSGYDYREYYDRDLADYVYSYLEEDFIYFNYNKDSWKDGTS